MARVGGVLVNFDPIQCSTEMWSWLSLTLGKSSHARIALSNSEELNGAEVDRRLATPQLSTSNIRRNALHDQFWSPVMAKAMSSVMDTVDAWEADVLAFKKAGGKEPRGGREVRATHESFAEQSLLRDAAQRGRHGQAELGLPD